MSSFKKIILTILALGVCMQTSAVAQSRPTAVAAVRYYGITAGTNLDCGLACIDNRSVFVRASNYHSYRVTGTGTWSVDMQYADGSGAFTSFGASAQVSNVSPSSGIGWGIGYHDYIKFVITGSATISNYFGTKDAWFAPAASGVNFPVGVGQGGTGGNVSTSWLSNLNYDLSTAGSAATTALAKLSQYVDIRDFGGTCDGVTPMDTAFSAAFTYLTGRGGGILHVPARSTPCEVNNTIQIPNGVHVIGDSLRGAGIQASTSFPPNTPVVCLGPCGTSTAQHYMSLQHMYVSCPPAGVVGCIAIFSQNMQENAWMDDVGIFNYTYAGIGMTGYGIQNTAIRNIYGAAMPGPLGYAAYGILLSAAQSRVSIKGVTLYSSNPFLQTGDAIALTNYSEANVTDVHCEQINRCISLDTGSTASIDNIRGHFTVGKIVYLSASSNGAHITNVVANNQNGPSPATISGLSSNAGVVRVTTSSAQNFSTGQLVKVENVVSSFTVNGLWYVTYVDATHFDLQGSVFPGGGTYTSGGSASVSEILVQDDIHNTLIDSQTDLYIQNYEAGRTGYVTGNLITSSPNLYSQFNLLQVNSHLKVGSIFDVLGDSTGATAFQTNQTGIYVQKHNATSIGVANGGVHMAAGSASVGSVDIGAGGDGQTFRVAGPYATGMTGSSGEGTLYANDNTAAANNDTFTPASQLGWNTKGIRIFPTPNAPSCAGANDIGRVWVNTSTTTTAYDICLFVSGSPSWRKVTTTAGP